MFDETFLNFPLNFFSRLSHRHPSTIFCAVEIVLVSTSMRFNTFWRWRRCYGNDNLDATFSLIRKCIWCVISVFSAFLDSSCHWVMSLMVLCPLGEKETWVCIKLFSEKYVMTNLKWLWLRRISFSFQNFLIYWKIFQISFQTIGPKNFSIFDFPLNDLHCPYPSNLLITFLQLYRKYI